MNQKAAELGAKNTHFINSSGLPGEGQHSTPYDLALIVRSAMKDPVISSILKQVRTVIQTEDGKEYHLKSHNKMLLKGRDVFGKTGYTRKAKYCFAGWIQGQDKNTVVVLMGSRRLWDDLSLLANRQAGLPLVEKKILSYGTKGENVRVLQAGLKRAGFFKGPITGYYGPKTKQAVMRFQKSKGLSIDGVAGTETQKILTSFL